MLCRGHGARVDIHVRINLDGGDAEANLLQQKARG
jgi:hypothetical protein